MAQDRGPQIIAIYALFLTLAYIFAGLRFYVRLIVTKCWGADDWLLLLALKLYTAYSVMAIYGVFYGSGRHIENIPGPDIPVALMIWYLCELVGTFLSTLIRASIGVFLLRISVRTAHKALIWTTMIFLTVYNLVWFFFILFQCKPFNYFWMRIIPGVQGECMDIRVVPYMSIGQSALSFFADWMFGLLPIALVWNLSLDKRNKISIAAVLSLGLLAGCATVIRIPYIQFLVPSGSDFLFATTDVAIWSTAEPGLGIIAASGATLRPLFRSFFGMTAPDGLTVTTADLGYPAPASQQTTSDSLQKKNMSSSSYGPPNHLELQKIVQSSPLQNYFDGLDDKEREEKQRSLLDLESGPVSVSISEIGTGEGKAFEKPILSGPSHYRRIEIQPIAEEDERQ